jgi:hypothetical protein
VTDGAAPFGDPVLKHLEFIQAVVTRLANNSFLLKGWALTVAGVFYGFAAKGASWSVAAVGLMPVVVFWGLDGYFLRQERLFRCLYDRVRQRDAGVEAFSMNTKLCAQSVPAWRRTLFSGTIWSFYLPIFAIGVVLTGLLH